MKVRTSVTLPKELLIQVDALVGKNRKRSAVVESALIEYVAKEKPSPLNLRDIEIINRNAELINKQVEETLEFQAEW
jgi:metal-responsive CopG/Arc/MetJ family transcriptional regulator